MEAEPASFSPAHSCVLEETEFLFLLGGSPSILIFAISFCACLLYFRAADWYYGCVTIAPYLKCLEPGVFQIWKFCIFWIISMHNAVLHLGVFVTFVTAVTRYTTGSNLARFIFFLFVSYSSWGGKIHSDTNAWWRECKESHIALALKTQRGEHWYPQCTLLFICLFNLGT